MLGFINVYKPSGMTSSAVVQKIKKKFHIKKIGHMGTLDPMACGVLPIAIGKATRMFDYSLNKVKRYIAKFDFGYTTDTLDITGTRTFSNGRVPSLDEVKINSQKLLGNISQIPPLYSAKNVNGKRAYDLARNGIEFELKPKDVIIYKCDVIEQVDNNIFKFDIICSSGTYIRSIARDLAKLSDTYGCMSALERIESGEFNKDLAIELDKLLEMDNCESVLLSPIKVFSNFDRLNIDEKTFNDLINGKKIDFKKFTQKTFIIYDDKIVGIAKCNSDKLILDTFLY